MKVNNKLKTNSRLIFLISLLYLTACHSGGRQEKTSTALSGKIIIFHAGSLTVPFKQIAAAFREKYPDVDILAEPAGSIACARKITDLNRPCDIIASSDYKVIEKMLIPEYTSWHIPFVTNEMVIAYSERSACSEMINKSNWPDILLRKDVKTGRSDPNSDPCGYRSVIVMKLAEKYYDIPEFASNLQGKDRQYIRPKEVDLLALLELGETDYIFIYRSVAEQHDLRYLCLPEDINLRDEAHAAYYQTATVEITGKTPADRIVMKGDPMIYSITLLNNAPNEKAAMAFMEFLLNQDQGMEIMESNGQSSVIPARSKYYEYVPEDLRGFVIVIE